MWKSKQPVPVGVSCSSARRRSSESTVAQLLRCGACEGAHEEPARSSMSLARGNYPIHETRWSSPWYRSAAILPCSLRSTTSGPGDAHAICTACCRQQALVQRRHCYGPIQKIGAHTGMSSAISTTLAPLGVNCCCLYLPRAVPGMEGGDCVASRCGGSNVQVCQRRERNAVQTTH